MQQEQTRLDFLDSLRGLAALFVLVFHVFRAPVPNLVPPEPMIAFVGFGYSGVWLFFVISAFSLCMTMPRHVATGIPLRSFFINRFFRIAPLFYVVMLYQAIYAYFSRGWAPDPYFILGSALFVFGFIPAWLGSAVAGGWAVGAEMVFYVTFPLIYFLLPGIRGKLVLIALSIAAYFVVSQYAGWMFESVKQFNSFKSRSILVHFPAFMLGMIAFDLFSRLRTRPDARSIGRLILLAGLGLFVVQFTGRHSLLLLDSRHIDSLAYAAIVLGAALVTPRLLSSPILTFYGRISFSVYLWHIQIVGLMSPLLQSVYAADFPVTFLAAVAITLCVTTALAYVSHRLIERPFEIMGRALVARLSKGRANPEGAAA